MPWEVKKHLLTYFYDEALGLLYVQIVLEWAVEKYSPYIHLHRYPLVLYHRFKC